MGGLPPEDELIERARRGDTEAFAAACERFRRRVWRIAASVAGEAEAEDLAQEAIVRAWQSLRSYRGDAPFEAWVCRIAVNAAHDLRKSAWRRRVSADVGAEACSESACPVAEAEARERTRRVRRAVAALPERQRSPIWLHYFEQFSFAEIARLERASESTIRSRVHAGLKRLAVSLDELELAAEQQPHRVQASREPMAGRSQG